MTLFPGQYYGDNGFTDSYSRPDKTGEEPKIEPSKSEDPFFDASYNDANGIEPEEPKQEYDPYKDNPFGTFDVPKQGTALTEFLKGFKSTGEQLLPPNLRPELPSMPGRGIAGTAGSVVASTVPSIAAILQPQVGVPVVLSMFAGTSAEQRFNETGDVVAAIGSGVFEAGSEMIGIGAATRLGAKASGRLGKMILSKNFDGAIELATSVAGVSAAEGFEELIPLIGDNTVDVVQGRKTVGQAVADIRHEAQGTFLAGAAGGLLMAGAGVLSPSGRAAFRAGVSGESAPTTQVVGQEQPTVKRTEKLALQPGQMIQESAVAPDTVINEPLTQRETYDNQFVGQGQVRGQEQVGQEPVQAGEQAVSGQESEAGGVLQSPEGEVKRSQPELPDLPPPENLLKGGREAGGVDVGTIHEIAAEAIATARRGQTASREVGMGVSKMAKKLIQRSSDYIASTGPVGKELSGVVKTIDLDASRRAKSAEVKIKKIFKNATAQQRRHVAMTVNGMVENPSGWAVKRAEDLRGVLDETLLNAARELGFERTLPSGRRALAGGSGKAMPQVPNAKGVAVLTDAKIRGLSSARVAQRAKEMVDTGKADNIDDALTQMKQYYDSLNRGLVPYLERSRTDFLKDDEIEWDPIHVLPGLLERSSVVIEAARQLGGPDMPKLDAYLMKMGQETDPSTVTSIEKYLKHEFGRSSEVDSNVAASLGAASNYISFTRLGYSLASAFRNSNQRYANSFDYPFIQMAKTIIQYPPFFNRWIDSSSKIREQVESLGVVRSTSDLGNVETGRRGEWLTENSLKWFKDVESNNQVFTAIMSKDALEADIRRLVSLEKGDGPLGRLVNTWLGSVSKRRLRRAGLQQSDIEALAEKVASGERLSFEDMQKAMDAAVKDTQFALTLATRPIWWSTNPWVRLLFKFKTFGTRQMGLIYNVALKELVEGNPLPFMRFVTYMIFTGELYNILRDMLTGREDSLTMEIINRPDRRNAADIAARMFADFADGGGLGLLADVTYGLADFAMGPAASVYQNTSELVNDIYKKPSMTLTALRRFVEKEASVSRQSTFLNHIDKAAFNKDNELISNITWRRRAYEFRDQKQEPSFAARVADRIINGFRRYERTDKTLAYEYAARQVDVGDYTDAEDYLYGIFSDARDHAELKKLVDSAKISMKAKSPLGAVAAKDYARFLKPFTTEQRKEAVDLQRKFVGNYSRAILRAANRARKDITPGEKQP